MLPVSTHRPINEGKRFAGAYEDEQGRRIQVVANVQYGDQHRNGHNTLSITGEVFYPGDHPKNPSCCGCVHDYIEKAIPELRPYIKWHLCSTDGPMHYAANVLYFAGDQDHNGLRKGEVRQLRNGKTGKLSWRLADHALPKYVDSDEKPTDSVLLEYVPWTRTGEGKEREFDKARSAAVWPEATDEQLSLPREELKALLEARLPQLMEDFKAAVEALGFVY